MIVRIALVLALLMGTAQAGPWCGGYETWTEAENVPAGGTIVRYVRDRWYGGKLDRRAKAIPVTATLDGKRVALRIRTARIPDGLVQWITLPRRTGALEISERILGTPSVVTSYTIVDDWQRPDAITATATRELNTGPYQFTGDVAALHLSGDPVALTVKSKRGTVTVPVQDRTAKLGKITCGWVENVPLADLEAGTKLTITATLADGSTMPVEGLDNPFVAPPRVDPPGVRKAD